MSCAPYPIEVRVGNVTLPTNNLVRGMNMSVGEPRQPIALLPLWPLNNTVIYGTNGYCLDNEPNTGTWTDTACATFRGGAYDSTASTARADADASAYPDDSAPNSGYPKVTHVADSLTLNDNVTLDRFPLSVALSDGGAQGYAPMMGLGLGVNSTLLNVLKSTGQIASRSYSYFWGSSVAGTSAGSLDGSVVFGGYDQAKVTGSPYTQPMTSSAAAGECASQLLVTISDIVLNFANGTDASIFPAAKSTSIAACLTPGLPTLMRMPLDPFFNNMMALTKNLALDMDRSQGIYYWNMRYETNSFTPYQGDMTIKLQSGLSVRIRNDQLVRSHTEIDQTTGVITVNATAPDLVIDSLQTVEATEIAQLGWQFFTAAYLHVNQDTNQFTLWEANPTSRTNLVAVDSNGTEITSFCSTASTSSASSTHTPTDATDYSQTSASSSSSPPPIGVIVGSSIAAVVVIAVAGFVLWWYRRKHMLQARQQAADQSRMADPTMANDVKPYPSAASSSGYASSGEVELESAVAPVELFASQYSYSGRQVVGIDQKEPHLVVRYELS